MFFKWIHIAGRRSSSSFSELAKASVDSIFRVMKATSAGSVNVLGDGDLSHLRIRLSEYSKVFPSLSLQMLDAILGISERVNLIIFSYLLLRDIVRIYIFRNFHLYIVPNTHELAWANSTSWSIYLNSVCDALAAQISLFRVYAFYGGFKLLFF